MSSSSTENLVARRGSGGGDRRLIQVRQRGDEDAAVAAAAAKAAAAKEEGNDARAVCASFLWSCAPTAGMIVAVVIWLTMGAFIFQYLEYENERAECNNKLADYTTAESSSHQLLKDLIYDAVDRPLNSSQALRDVEARVRSTLRAFSAGVIDTNFAYGPNCSLVGMDGGPPRIWTLGASFFFCSTVVTTIGYGNIAAKTMWGRLVCIFYAILGIPITLLCLAYIGQLLANVIRFIYSTVCCCSCCRCARGDEDEDDEGYEKLVAASTQATQREKQQLPPQPRWVTDATGKPLPNQPPPSSWAPKKGSVGEEAAPVVDEEGAYEEEEEEEEEEQLSVPFIVPLLAIVFFIVTGAPLFNVWEDWKFVDGCYFCLITMTTIGFGDLYPNYAQRDAAGAQVEIMVSVLYMFLGVSTLAMCMQLVQEDIIARVKRAASRIGLSRRTGSARSGRNDEEDEDDA